MRKYITLLLLVLFCSSALCAEASVGNVEVHTLPEQNIDVTYTKVGTWKEGDLVLEETFAESGVDLNGLKKSKDTKHAIETLEAFQKVPSGKVSTKRGVASIQDLEEGIYLMQGTGGDAYEVQSALITIPAWDSAMEEMNYEIEWNPKVNAVVKAAATGDANPLIFVLIICMISLLFVVRTLYFSLRLC